MRHVAALFLVLGLAGSGAAYRILCLLPYPGKSHHMVFEPLLQELTDRGHSLTVASFFPADNPGPNRRDVSLLELTKPYVEVVDLNMFEFTFFGLERYVEHAPLVMNLARSNLQLCERLLDFPAFEEFVEARGDYDLMIVEHFNSDCMMGIVHKYGIPSVGLMSSAILPWTAERLGFPDNPAYVPGMTLRVTDRMSLLERIENTFFLYFYKLWFRWEIRPKEQALLESKFGPLPPLEEVAKNSTVVLVNTHHSLSGVKAFVPAVVEVGGVHLHGRSLKPLPPDMEKFISEAPAGVILVSFGSLIRSSSLPQRRRTALLRVLARLPQRVLWKWEAEGDSTSAPGNVLTSAWLPQYDVLNHPKCVAFISHGGLLSMTEAVDAGVPMLVIPVLGDQFGNAEHARAAGLARVLHYTDLEETALERAVNEVLQPQMRASAQRLSRVWRDREAPPILTAVYAVERAARLGNDTDMAGSARRMPAYQIMLLDIFAVAALVLAAIIAILYYAITAAVGLLIRPNNKVKLS